MAGVVRKATTGFTGMAVSRYPHQSLKILYEKILRTVAKMPANAAYRKYTEQIVNDRLHVVKTEPNIEKLEAKIDCGIVEELVIQAERELMLSRKMLEWKPWEPLVSQAPKNQWTWPL